MQERGIDGLTVLQAELFNQLDGRGLDKTHEAVLLPGLRGSGQDSQQCGQHYRQSDSFLIFSAHPLRLKSQPLNRGSITM